MEDPEEIYCKVKVYPWRNKQEFVDTYNLIYSPSATAATKKKACELLMVWRLRRAQDTPNSILCTYSLLEAHLKDEMKLVKGNSSLCTIYSSSLTKFVNFALSSISGNMSMYRAAERLGIDSFIIDIRHLCSHGTQSPQLEVFRKSNIYCLDWLKTHYWEKEIAQLEDVSMEDIKSKNVLAFEAQVTEMFLVLDASIEGLCRGFVNYQQAEEDETWPNERKNILKNCLDAFQSDKLAGIKNYVRDWLIKSIGTKDMKDNSRSFFRLFIQKCEFLMKSLVEDEIEIQEEEEPPTKKIKKKQSCKIIVKQHINHIIREIVTQEHLQDLIHELFYHMNNTNEFIDKRNIAQKWIIILLKSFKAYQDYCDLQESLDEVLSNKKVNKEIEKTYSEELKVNLDEIFIFVGCLVLPSYLKFPRSLIAENLNKLDANNKEVCENLLPFINPPLDQEKTLLLSNVIQIQTQDVAKPSVPSADVFTTADLKEVLKIGPKSEKDTGSLWKLSTADIDWSTCPIGTLFS